VLKKAPIREWQDKCKIREWRQKKEEMELIPAKTDTIPPPSNKGHH